MDDDLDVFLFVLFVTCFCLQFWEGSALSPIHVSISFYIELHFADRHPSFPLGTWVKEIGFQL